LRLLLGLRSDSDRRLSNLVAGPAYHAWSWEDRNWQTLLMLVGVRNPFAFMTYGNVVVFDASHGSENIVQTRLEVTLEVVEDSERVNVAL
jgi:hypothetical protein